MSITEYQEYNNFGDELGQLFGMIGKKKEQEAKVEQAKAEGRSLADIAWYGRGTKQNQSSVLSELLGAGIAGKSTSKSTMWIAIIALIGAFALFMYFLLKKPTPVS